MKLISLAIEQTALLSEDAHARDLQFRAELTARDGFRIAVTGPLPENTLTTEEWEAWIRTAILRG